MKILKFWEQVNKGEPARDLDWIHNFVKTLTSNRGFDCKIEKKGNKVIVSNSNTEIYIEDNNKPNDFFFVKIIHKDKTILNFDKHDNGEEYSPDELPSENIAIFISKYFQK